jgi:tRNA/rRNA methyltransferase
MQISFVLVEPQLGVNIGAVARAMSNFGLTDLRIVNPRDGWPNPDAKQMSAHGLHLIEGAAIHQDLHSAIADLDFIIATSARRRDMQKGCITPKDLTKTIETTSIQKLGILFGRESSGLSNEEVSHAHCLLHIPTSDENKALNLAQASCIVAYELMQVEVPNHEKNQEFARAAKAEIEFLLDKIYKEVKDTDNVDTDRNQRMIKGMRDLLLKAEATSSEIKILHGLLNAISRK